MPALKARQPWYLMKIPHHIALFVIGLGFAQSYGVADSEWYFGNYLKTGDEFGFEICDYYIKSGNPCYEILLKFVAFLPNNGDHAWVVSAHIEDQKPVDIILHISQSTKKISTDIANRQYAESLSRTWAWINQFASQNKPQILEIGKVWGHVNSDRKPIELVVTSMELVDGHKTYTIQYTNLKSSQIILKEGIPFPVFAQIYKPVFSHQDAPKEFTLKMKDIKIAPKFGLMQSEPEKRPQIAKLNHTINEFGQNDVFGNFTVYQILNHTIGKNYTDYFDQAVGNFTKFLELISTILNTNVTSN